MEATMSHLKDQHMDYWKHFRKAADIAVTMQVGAAIATIHAILPEVFKTETTQIIDHLHKKKETSE